MTRLCPTTGELFACGRRKQFADVGGGLQTQLAKPDSQRRDYHFMPDMNVSRTRLVRILSPRARLYFLVARRRALASGSLSAI
ncbi:hypothetical protein K438DRAFT_1971689 [Mycena galopus ATCC 62051]|nr:hypothetical protein K438DRAFT_1971689 [Mycena galopus ATCC 62051]